MGLFGPRGDGRRVVVTGMGLRSPIGATPDEFAESLHEGRSGIVAMPEWAEIEGIESRVAGVVPTEDSRSIPRRQRRSMGRTSLLATLAAGDAIAAAGLDRGDLGGGRCGVSVAATIGSAAATDEFCTEIAATGSVRGLKSTTFLRFMGHSPAANVALSAGITGRCLSPTCACSSGTQAIGLAAEAIATGLQDVMLAGGAEELHHTVAATFAAAGAASRSFNDRPTATPRPFDSDRDGLVVGEGAGIVVLEERGRAAARGAEILGEVVGFATTTDPTHMTDPDPGAMERGIRLALESGLVEGGQIGYVNAHATGTRRGDAAEAEACRRVFGDRVPLGSTKGFTGHGLGAAGALESIVCLLALGRGWLPQTLNLEQIDPACDGLDHLTTPRQLERGLAVNQSFAFGGTGAVLIFADEAW